MPLPQQDEFGENQPTIEERKKLSLNAASAAR